MCYRKRITSFLDLQNSKILISSKLLELMLNSKNRNQSFAKSLIDVPRRFGNFSSKLEVVKENYTKILPAQVTLEVDEAHLNRRWNGRKMPFISCYPVHKILLNKIKMLKSIYAIDRLLFMLLNKILWFYDLALLVPIWGWRESGDFSRLLQTHRKSISLYGKGILFQIDFRKKRFDSQG